MAKDIIFSVIIPAKDEGNYIGKCLEGIRSLDFDQSKIEVLVVDNGSSDETVSIAKKMGAKVIEVQRGTISNLRNQGARFARGSFLAFIDADCIPHKNWLRNALPHFSDPAAACVGSKPVLPENDGFTWVQNTWSLMKMKPKLSKAKWLSSCNLIIRKAVFEYVHGFDPSLETCEDADLGFRISRKWNLVNDPLVSVTHLREPRTVLEFLKKEVWHGVGNNSGFMKHGFVIQELPSLIWPYWTIFCFGGIMLSLFLLSFRFISCFVLLFLLVPIALTVRAVSNSGQISSAPKFFLLYIVYCLARSASIFKCSANYKINENCMWCV